MTLAELKHELDVKSWNIDDDIEVKVCANRIIAPICTIGIIYDMETGKPSLALKGE